MTQKRWLTVLWGLLIILTVSGSWLGEFSQPGPATALFLCLTMAFKGRMVIDHFMELKSANRHLRLLMRVYFYLLPLLAMIVYLAGDLIAELTAI